MSAEAVTWALQQPIKRSSAKFLLTVLAHHVNADAGDMLAWPSIASLCESTSQDRKTVIGHLQKLIEDGFIEDTKNRKGGTGQIVVYRLKRTDNGTIRTVPKTVPLNGETVPLFPSNSTVFSSKESRFSVERVPKTGHGTGREQEGKRKGTGKPIQQSLRDRFDRFWVAYPKKEEKQAAFKAFAKINPDERLLETMLAALDVAKRSEQWRNRKFIKQPPHWLNAGCWDDELIVEYSTVQSEVISSYNACLGDLLGRIDPALFAQSRASAIDHFLGFPSKNPESWKRYFAWVADHVDVPPHCGFDYLISTEGYTKVAGGQFTRETV